MIICACISAPGISVRQGWFRSCALSPALSLNLLFPQTNFTAVALIKGSAHCDFLFNQSFSNSILCASKTEEIQNKISIGKKNAFIQF